MLKSVEHHLSISALDPEISALSGEWTQDVSGHSMKVSVSGTVPYNLMMASKLATDLNTQINRVICQHIEDAEPVE
jgi:hypothetical protein